MLCQGPEIIYPHVELLHFNLLLERLWRGDYGLCVQCAKWQCSGHVSVKFYPNCGCSQSWFWQKWFILKHWKDKPSPLTRWWILDLAYAGYLWMNNVLKNKCQEICHCGWELVFGTMHPALRFQCGSSMGTFPFCFLLLVEWNKIK